MSLAMHIHGRLTRTRDLVHRAPMDRRHVSLFLLLLGGCGDSGGATAGAATSNPTTVDPTAVDPSGAPTTTATSTGESGTDTGTQGLSGETGSSEAGATEPKFDHVHNPTNFQAAR